jgi:hypothetical protein
VKKLRKWKPKAFRQYTLLDEVFASDRTPIPKAQRVYQLTQMWAGLASLEKSDNPTTNDWRVCSDAVNLMETLVGMNICEDSSGLLNDAIEALALAGKRHMAGNSLRLSGAGIQTVRSVLEDYADMLEVLPHRTVVRCHRLTEQRIREIMAGRGLAHDVEIISI